MRLFRSKDVDGSGTLDMQEFVELVHDTNPNPNPNPNPNLHPYPNTKPNPSPSPSPSPNPNPNQVHESDLLNHREQILLHGRVG